MSWAFQKLEEQNDSFVFMDVTEVLLKTLENILREPENPRHRKLEIINGTVSGIILPAEGGLECLLYLGFEQIKDAFVLPGNVPPIRIRNLYDELSQCRKRFLSKIKTDYSISKSPVPRERTLYKKMTPKDILMNQIETYSKQVLKYECKALQAAARSKIPFDKLQQELDKKKRDKMDDFDKEFGFLYEMMIWFKTDFFRWMDNPVCKDCDSSSTFQGFSTNPANFSNTDRVEVYMCDDCDARLLFPRYNDPEYLLKTRIGRCGEWANCFTLLCRTVGYDARFVVDKTDHVWTEIYSDSLQRWIHCDPCENLIDVPLTYEKGWDKKLSYIFAFSKDEAQDVTWRYTSQFADVRSRRTICTEQELLKKLFDITDNLQATFPEERKKYLRERCIAECVEFLTPPHADKQYGERISGSLQWRLSRGECQYFANKWTWQPNEIEIERKRFRLRYSTVKDTYFRVESNETMEKWNRGVYECEAVFRKVELDWRMCYLCRTEGMSNGSVKWKLCVERTGVAIDKVVIRYLCTTFHTGSVRLFLCDKDTSLSLDPNETVFETESFRGSHDLSLTAVMNGGNEIDSWQHAQLFRQSIDDDRYLFEIDVTFYEDPKNVPAGPSTNKE